MKALKDEELKALMIENEELFGEYDKVVFIAKIKDKDTELNGIRLLDKHDNEHFIVKTKNQGHFSFTTDDVKAFRRVSTEKYEQEVETPATKLQQAVAKKIQLEREKTSEDSRNIAEGLASTLGYFPLLNAATVTGLTIDFMDKEHELIETIFFPFTKGETYEVYSHDDERNIEVSSLMVDGSLATDLDDNDVSPETFAKYYETYKAIEDLEFVTDNEFTKDIFNEYNLDPEVAKVVGDLSKHDLLVMVEKTAKDENIQEAAKELRLKTSLVKKETSRYKP